MTKIEAIIRPSALGQVEELFSHPWIAGMTVSEVKGYGRQKGHTELYRGAEYLVDLRPKLKLELVLPDPLVPRVLEDLRQLLRTGQIGDGKLFVTPVEQVVRIRTGERGERGV
ncbi:MAG TPA: P-II family nitrogen regulator [Anaeromyxobacter sp.]|nr:P-II family nitrogen regulator [Anaeromyxobacter sp.]